MKPRPPGTQEAAKHGGASEVVTNGLIRFLSTEILGGITWIFIYLFHLNLVP